MPLLDHFRPPLDKKWPWEGIHSDWASSITRQLSRTVLPERFVAIPRVYFGGRVEIDVATVEQAGIPATQGGGTATAVWAPPRPTVEAPVAFEDVDAIEIQVFDREAGWRLAAAIELISPANKDRASHREAFRIKCAGYLQQGVSLVIVDVVTSRTPNLHRELLELLSVPAQTNGRTLPELYAVAYRVLAAAEKATLQAWEEALEVGKRLPTIPLWLTPELVVPLNLEESYTETCEVLRIRP